MYRKLVFLINEVFGYKNKQWEFVWIIHCLNKPLVKKYFYTINSFNKFVYLSNKHVEDNARRLIYTILVKKRN